MSKLNKYVQLITTYLSDLTNQRAVLYLAIGGVSICLILIVLGFIFPQGIPTNNQTVQDSPNQVVTTDSGLTSSYTAQEAMDLVKDAIKSDNVDAPDCDLEEAKWTPFFSHRGYWKLAVLCPPDVANSVHAWTEYTYEFNEGDASVKDTTLQ